MFGLCGDEGHDWYLGKRKEDERERTERKQKETDRCVKTFLACTSLASAYRYQCGHRPAISIICLTYLKFGSILWAVNFSWYYPFYNTVFPLCFILLGIPCRERDDRRGENLALRHLQRDGNHISAGILLREERGSQLSWMDRLCGRHLNLREFTRLHCIAFMGITGIAIDKLDMKRWDPNGSHSCWKLARRFHIYDT